ncbi:Uu.00g111470.m01.CDS01 [Anthostomella pinea]|uniref:Uu.00g111470.m01.CDS01 n=1 Tax=Anthostomella pinea TaxID=933095 RepID=A0AAI8VF26_9PEZI|nr:Uu.00g111470.m01.CDS01 [Anthostomella pinea]
MSAIRSSAEDLSNTLEQLAIKHSKTSEDRPASGDVGNSLIETAETILGEDRPGAELSQVEARLVTLELNKQRMQKNADTLLNSDRQQSLQVTASLLFDDPEQSTINNNVDLLLDEDLEALDGATEAWWTSGAHVIPQYLIEEVDESIKALMPDGTEIVSIGRHGNSTWSRTAEIKTELHGEPVSYFVKVTDYRSGEIMYRSEFESLKAIHAAVPGFCPRPIGWGCYASDPNVHLLLTAFVKMLNKPAHPVLLPRRLAELHQKATAPGSTGGTYLWLVVGCLLGSRRVPPGKTFSPDTFAFFSGPKR